jgi:protein-tyrosine phosphatase
MIEVYLNLFVGNDRECFRGETNEWAVVHACKSPCHQNTVGYKGSLPSSHPNYLIYEKPNHLFLNIIDPPVPLFQPQLFTKSLDFIDYHVKSRKVLVHCNDGFSRAPSIALLFLAKKAKKINNESFEQAAIDFKKLYKYYQPSRGITIYLNQNWTVFDT